MPEGFSELDKLEALRAVMRKSAEIDLDAALAGFTPEGLCAFELAADEICKWWLVAKRAAAEMRAEA